MSRSPDIVAAIVRRGSRLLLVEEQEPGDEAPTWMLPGGQVEGGEQPIEALRRELAEETSMALRGEPVVAFSVEVDFRSELAGGVYRAVTYACAANGSPQPNDPDGLVRRAVWLEKEQAIERLAAVGWYEAEPLRRFLAGAAPAGARYRYRVTGPANQLVREAFEELS